MWTMLLLFQIVSRKSAYQKLSRLTHVQVYLIVELYNWNTQITVVVIKDAALRNL